MRSSIQGRWYLLIVAALFVAVISNTSLYAAQGDTTICINVVSERQASSVNFEVTWHPCQDGEQLLDDALRSYTISLYPKDDKDKEESVQIKPQAGSNNSLRHTFADRQYEKVYCIEVVGIDNADVMHKADTCGLYAKNGVKKGEGFLDQLGGAFTKSTIFGKAAFIVIGIFLVVGIAVFWFLKAWSTFRAENVFVKARKEYRQLNPIWKKSKDIPKPEDSEGNKNPGGTSPAALTPEQEAILTELMDAEKKCPGCQTAREIWDKNESLIENVDLFRNKFLKSMSVFFDKIFYAFSCRWILSLLGRKPTLDFHEVPTLRIMKSALDASKNGKDIHNALDVRVASEISKLRERGFIDAIWGLGVTAPLLGLFGTITGLTMAFRKVEVVSATNPDQILKELGGGIYEALWTTFFGLLTGIVLMLVYYYYNYKLERITALWEDLSANLMDLLKNHHGGASK